MWRVTSSETSRETWGVTWGVTSGFTSGFTSGLIDLNADLGEECGDDAAMLDVVTSANVACGAHAGGGAVMWETVREARRRAVVVGAHVSYPDREGFGRRPMSMPHAALVGSVRSQIEAVAGAAEGALRYVKAHGALYNTIAEDDAQAAAVLEALSGWPHPLALLTLPGGRAADRAAAAGVRVVAEGFADRAYQPDGSLVPRSQPGAVLHGPQEVAAQALALAASGRVQSLCVHGDTPGAVALARAVRRALEDAGYTLGPFCR